MCKPCSRGRKSVSGMNRSKIVSVLVTGAKVGAGYGASRIISGMGFAQANPMLQVALPLGGALLTHSVLGKKGSEIAAGMAAGGIISGIQQYLPSVAATLNLPAPAIAGVPYRSLNSPGVAGMRSAGSTVKVRYQ